MSFVYREVCIFHCVPILAVLLSDVPLCIFLLLKCKEVDKQLKLICEKFISDVTASLSDPLKALLSKIDVIFEMAAKDKLNANTLLQQQPFTAAGQLS